MYASLYPRTQHSVWHMVGRKEGRKERQRKEGRKERQDEEERKGGRKDSERERGKECPAFVSSIGLWTNRACHLAIKQLREEKEGREKGEGDGEKRRREGRKGGRNSLGKDL